MFAPSPHVMTIPNPTLWTSQLWTLIVLTCSKFPLIICKSGWIIWQRSCSWYVEARNLHNSKRQSSSDAAVASSCVGQSPILPCLPLHSLTIPSPRKFNLSKMFHVGPKWCEIMKWSDRVLDIASNTFFNLYTHSLSAVDVKADVKKCKRLTILPISKYSVILFLCSFLFSLFKSFHIDHGAWACFSSHSPRGAWSRTLRQVLRAGLWSAYECSTSRQAQAQADKQRTSTGILCTSRHNADTGGHLTSDCIHRSWTQICTKVTMLSQN